MLAVSLCAVELETADSGGSRRQTDGQTKNEAADLVLSHVVQWCERMSTWVE